MTPLVVESAAIMISLKAVEPYDVSHGIMNPITTTSQALSAAKVDAAGQQHSGFPHKPELLSNPPH
jgi:hypothetical protein